MGTWTGRATAAVATAALLATGLAFSAGDALAQVALVRVGHAASMPMFTSVQRPLRSTTHLRLSLSLRPRDAAALQRFATEVSTPGTAEYGHYLSVKQFAARFGATGAAVGAVTRTLRGDGLSVSKATANNLMVTVSGTAGAIDNAMRARLSAVELPDGRHAYANLAAPAFAPSIAHDIQGVIGLDDVTPVESAGLVRGGSSARSPLDRATERPAERRPEIATGGAIPSCSFAPGAGNDPQTTGQNGYSYDQLAAAYGFSSLYGAGDLGQNETVALVELEPYSTTDIATFQACYGTGVPVTQVNVNGGPSSDDNCSPGSGTCSDGEAALDIETVLALAPRAAIDVYEGPDSAGIGEAAAVLNQIVSDNKAKIISTSFGVCEAATPAASLAAENTALQEAATQGQSFFSASGDSGSETCSQLGATTGNPFFNEGGSVEDPAAQPFATGVGGTEMFDVNGGEAEFDDTGAPRSEVVWNEGTNPKCGCGGTQADGFGGGSGGGISKQWPMPSYQATASAALGVVGPDSSGAGLCGAATCREVPDVSANADGTTGYIVYTSDNGSASWAPVAGTSAASPLWAAYMALVDADPACRNLTIGFANPELYALASSAYGTDFYDVQASSALATALDDPLQQISNNDTLYQWGVTSSTNPNSLYPVTAGYDMATGLGSMQASQLAQSLCTTRAPVYTVAVTSPGTQTDGTALPVNLQLAATDSGGSAATLSYTASGLPAGLTMSTAGLVTGTPTTVGSGTVTVTATDQYTNTASTAFTWTVVKPTAPTGKQSLSAAKNGKAKFGLKLTAGTYAPSLAKVKISVPKSLSFTRKAKSLKKGITVKSGSAKVPYTVSGGGGSVTLTFTTPEPALTISVTKPAITESKSLISSLQQKSTKKHKRKKFKVKITVVVTDANSVATYLAHSFKL